MPDSEVFAKQALRMRRFLMSIATYVACGVVVQVCAWLGFLPSWLPAWWALGALAVNGMFFLMFRSGWNLKLKDPSMTEIQLLASTFAVMALISQADEARGALLMLVPVPLLFGILRLNFRQMARVGALGLLIYLAVIATITIQQPERVRLGLEALNLIALASVMFFVCIMCGYISKVRSDLAIAVRTIREQADRDALTGLFNRRNFIERLDVELARCARGVTQGITLCMLDLDNFKQINDQFGHPAGDEVLVQVGKCLRDSIRTTDYVARFGGEEFAVLLDGNSNDPALAVSERMRVKIEQLQIPVLQGLAISTSIGVAHLANGESSTSVIARADHALYLAKAQGRNRICCADEAQIPPLPTPTFSDLGGEVAPRPAPSVVP